jgi:hypothetical protein
MTADKKTEGSGPNGSKHYQRCKEYGSKKQ